jgi:hypothetical protein
MDPRLRNGPRRALRSGPARLPRTGALGSASPRCGTPALFSPAQGLLPPQFAAFCGGAQQVELPESSLEVLARGAIARFRAAFAQIRAAQTAPFPHFGRAGGPLPRGLCRGLGAEPPPATRCRPLRRRLGPGRLELGHQLGARRPPARGAALCGGARLASGPAAAAHGGHGCGTAALRSTEGRRRGGEFPRESRTHRRTRGSVELPAGGARGRRRRRRRSLRRYRRSGPGKRPSRPGAWAPGRLGGFLVAAREARARGGPRAANRTRRGLALVGGGWQGLAARARVHAASARSMRADLAREPRFAAR